MMKNGFCTAGFTLIELLTAIIVLVVISGIALPNFSRLQANGIVVGVANEILGVLQYARAQAISEKAERMVCPTGAGAPPFAAADWDNGFFANDAADCSGTIIRIGYASSAEVSGPTAMITFDSLGSADAEASFTVTHPNSDRTRWVCVYQSGRLEVRSSSTC